MCTQSRPMPYIRICRLEEAEELLKWVTGIGSWLFSRSDDMKYPDADNVLDLKANTMKLLREYPVRPITLKDEYDMDTIRRRFEERRRNTTRAGFVGRGKSYACEQMEKRGHKVLFACPSNKLASNRGGTGCTINRFFFISVIEDSKRSNCR